MAEPVADWILTYDPRTDSLSILLKEGCKVVESEEDRPGVILDYDGCNIFRILRFT